MSVNQTTSTYDFSGSLPRHYDDHLGPMFFEPYAVAVANRINPEEVRLAVELAAGTGRVTRHLRSLLMPSARLIASDISEDMLAIAREKLSGQKIEWQMIDAGNLPFDEGSVDLVVCCFGYMFVPDKDRAFSEARRVLRNGGMLIFSTWDSLENNGASLAYRRIAREYLEDPLPECYNLPFSMSDEMQITRRLEQAGFRKLQLEKLASEARSTSAADAAEGLVQGGLIYNELMKRNPAWVDEVRERVEKALAREFGKAPMVSPMSAVVVRAWK